MPPLPADVTRRVALENVRPEVDGGRFPAKSALGDPVQVEVDLLAEGHDALAGALLWRPAGEEGWREVRLEPLVNDRWRASFEPKALGIHEFTLEGWVDRFATWQRDLRKRISANQDVSVDLQIGADLAREAAGRAQGEDRAALEQHAAHLEHQAVDALLGDPSAGLSPVLGTLASRYADRSTATRLDAPRRVRVDPPWAAFSAWYELFPRSASLEPGRHGTLRDVEARLPYVARMGFDVLYLPPIHPIGRAHRKGRDNATVAEPEDVGSPWAIGSDEGGHTSIHPELGTLEDFDRLVAAARTAGIELALDIAFQCAPDHPWVREHPEWFRRRPDGTIQYAENPPKRYQDIYPFDFESGSWPQLWQALREVFAFWAERGVRIFRVDNPHTKPFGFWEWVLADLQADHPDLIFLSEAFTRPKVMYRLAKVGFTQSYTYFAWRRTATELEGYMRELTSPPLADFFRPNLWPNTPDILTEQLQAGGRAIFAQRLLLAATLSANYGLYGPAYELLEAAPLRQGSEEYLGSEKYQLRHWDLGAPHSLAALVSKVNQVRRAHPALQRDRHLHFHPVDNGQLLAYSKRTPDRSDVVLVVANLDPHHAHSGWVDLDLEELGVQPQESYQMHELLTGARYLWSGARNYVHVDPHESPAQILLLRRRLRSEQDFDYFL